MGMAGVLDSSRLRFFIAEKLDVPPASVEAMTLGSHGDQMVALPRQATVQGTAAELVDEPTLEQLFQRTKDAGAEIVKYLQKGSAFDAPSSAALAWSMRSWGIPKRSCRRVRGPRASMGSPTFTWGPWPRSARVVSRGIVELDLNEDELTQLREAAEAIRDKCKEVATSPQ